MKWFLMLVGLICGFIVFGVRQESSVNEQIKSTCVKTDLVVKTRGGWQPVYDCGLNKEVIK